MKKSLISLVCIVLTFSLASTSYGVVIGDWEGDSLDNWDAGLDGTAVMTNATNGVTLGSNSLGLIPTGGYWNLKWQPETVPTSLADQILTFDLTMLASEWPSQPWTKVADKIALNSDSPDGWKEYNNVAVATDRLTAEVTSLDWGAWAGDAYKTYSLDISDYDLTGATYFQIHISVQGGDGVGNFYFDNAQIVPEPATIALLGLGGLALIRKKRD